MHKMQTIATDVRGVCLTVSLLCGSTRLHCVKMAQRIKVQFGVNTLGGPWNIVLHGVLITHRYWDRELGKILPVMYFSGTAEAND